MNTEKFLSSLIQQTRKQQGLSREALAGLAQVSTTFIRDAEKDVSQCSFGKLMRLLEALGLQWKVSGASQ
jgi:transcriptional regulator with XRE-family HTH domain